MSDQLLQPAPARTPIDPGVDRLWKVVAGDFDLDGWFELCGWDDHTLYALDPVDKTVLWKTLQGSKEDFDLFTGPGRIYVSTESELIALDASTSQRVWSAAVYNVREIIDPGDAPNGVIWANVADEELHAIDRATGALRGSRKMNDSAGMFRTLCGQNLVWNDADGVTILNPADQPLLAIGGSVEEAMAAADQAMQALATGQKAGKITIPDQVFSAVVHRGVLYVYVNRNTKGCFIDAYRASDGKQVARRQLQTLDSQLVTAVNGCPIAQEYGVLKREPDGQTWTAPGNDAEIEWTRGVGNVLVVLAKRREMGNDVWDLIGLDGSSFAQLWKLEKIGYVYGEIAVTSRLLVVTIQGDGTQTLIGIDPASGARLWEAGVPREEGTKCGGGLVWQTRYGTAVFAGSGQQIFPTDQRTATPPMAALVPEPDEMPSWGAAPAPVSTGMSTRDGKKLGIIVVLAILGVIGVLVAVIALTRK